MARSTLDTARTKPQTTELVTLEVLRRELVSPNVARVTLGRGDVEKFVPLGFDQWFRLFIPVSDDSLSRVPNRLSTLSYAKFLTVSKTVRPILRNYTVRAYRAEGADGPEVDVDFVIHGSASDGTAGPASTWASTCEPGAVVGILDEGLTFNPPPGITDVVLVADETALPAVAGILASLPRETTGHAIIEVPEAADRQEVEAPDGVSVTWVTRDDPAATPGPAALAAAVALGAIGERTYAWVAGESALPVALRRLWVAAGVPKHHISFCGYWKAGRHH